MIVDTTQITTPGYTGRDIEEILYAFYRKYGNDIENRIIYFDEIDKKGSRKHSDVGGRGVLDVLLAFLDGTTYQACDSSSRPTDIVPINTSRMIKIAGGAFSDLDDYKKPLIGFGSDSSNTTQPSSGEFVKDGEMSSEFMGRFPSRVRFNTLDVPRMEEILRKSDESMVLRQIEVFNRLGTKLTPTDRYIEEVAKHAVGTGGGARGLSGFVLETTGPAYEDINMNLGEIAEIVLTDDTVRDPSQYQKILRK
jgi:ATP-dependent protease Clp ATPase subunit